MAGSLEAQTLYQDKLKSVALVELDGVNNVVKNNGSKTTYEIMSGSGVFYIGTSDTESKVREVGPGDKIIIPVGATYQDIGQLVMLVTCEPPFDPKDVQLIKHRL